MSINEITTTELIRRANTRRPYRYESEVVAAIESLDIPECEGIRQSDMSVSDKYTQIYNYVVIPVFEGTEENSDNPAAILIARTFAETVMAASRNA